MRATAILFAMSACAAMAQDTSVARLFQLHHVGTEQDLQEFAALIRTIADRLQATADSAQKTIAVRGTATQIAIAEWLYTEIDRQTVPDSVTQEFKVSADGSDVVHVFYLKNTPTIQSFQEINVTIRTIAEIRRVFTYETPRAIVARGTADQIAAAAFMIHELDQPASAKRTDSRPYQMIDTGNHGETEVRVFYIPYAATVQSFQEVATLIRTIGEIRRVFTYNASKAMIARGTADQMALTEWFVKELGKPATAESASQTYTYPDSSREGANQVRVFYVKDVPTVQAFQQVATQIRTMTKIRRVFTYNATYALAVRGTAQEVAMAEQMLQDRARQVAAK
jgi:hypothetical protein